MPNALRLIIIFLWSTVCNKVNCISVYLWNISPDSITQYVLMFYQVECGGVELQQPLWSGTQVLEDPGDKHVTFVCWMTDVTAVLFGHTCLCLLSRNTEPLNEGWKRSRMEKERWIFFFLRPVHVWWSAVRWGEIYFLPLLRFSSCLWLRSHIWTPAGHARNHFSIPAIYCNALQMLQVVCVYVLRGVTSRGRQNTSLRLRGDGYQKVNSAKCICTALQEE